MPHSSRSRRATTTRWLLIGAALFCVLLGSPATALDRDRSISQFEHRAWRSKDGAPSQIHALAQTTDGYLWIGSAQGLFRFDAVRFEEYVPQRGVKLPSHNIYALMATPDGALWVAFRPSGVGVLKDGQLTVFSGDDEPSDSRVHSFARDQQGRIWAGSETGLYLREGSRWRAVGRDWNLPSEMIRALFVDRQGTLWVATVNSISHLPRGSTRFEPTPVDVGRDVTTFAQSKDGRVWFAADQTGIARPVPLTAGESGTRDPAIVSATLNQLLFDRDGAMWITGLNATRIMRVRYPERLGSRRVRTGDPEIEWFDEHERPSGGQAYMLLEDREGNIWVGSSNGLDRFRQSEVVSVRLPNPYQGLTLLPGAEGDVWVGYNDDVPLLRLRGEAFLSEWAADLSAVARSAKVEAARVGARASSVFRASNGDVWWGCYDGLWRQRGTGFEFFPLPSGVVHDFIYEIFPSGADDGLWVRLGDVGLVHFSNGTWDLRRKLAGLPEIGPSASHVTPSGTTWLGYRTGQVYRLDGQRVTAYTERDGLSVGRIKVIRGLGSHIWIGGELGAMLFVDGRFHEIRTVDGESFGAVSGIIETATSGLWLNELRGIEHIPAQEVAKLLADPRHPVRYRRYNYLDGVLAPPQMNFTNSTAVRGSDGRLWFATDNGLVWIDPHYIVSNALPPPVSILSISSENGRHTSPHDIKFAAGTRTVEIDYSALSLSIPERIAFRYRLDGVDDQWQSVGNRRQAYYTSLRPGHYRFHVVASNNDGVWNEAGAQFTFEILSPWWSTAWFKALLGLLLVATVYVGYTYRVRQLATRFEWRLEERIAERTRIARELHDTLIQGFQGLMFRLQAVRALLPDRSAEAMAALDIALERGTEAIAEGRDAVQGLRAAPPDHHDLANGLRTRAQELAAQASPAPPTFRLVVDGRPRRLDALLHDDIQRIASEALSNAYRHASATAIEAEVSYRPGWVRVRIRDNGIGIDPRVRDRGGRAGHWGLVGMRERAVSLGGRLDVWTQGGAGTEVDLMIPTSASAKRLAWHWTPGFLSRKRDAREQQQS